MVSVPERIEWTLRRLDVRPADRVFEVGCGTGVLATLIADSAPAGRYVGLDRSATAASATRRRLGTLSPEIEAEVRHGSLAEFEPDEEGQFTKAVAVNVNLFWTGPAAAELTIVRRSLELDGFLLLVFQTPGSPERLLRPLTANLERAGYDHVEELIETTTMRLLAVECRPPAPKDRSLATS